MESNFILFFLEKQIILTEGHYLHFFNGGSHLFPYQHFTVLFGDMSRDLFYTWNLFQEILSIHAVPNQASH